MKKIKNIFILALSLSVISSCDLNLQQDPNELSPEQASIDFVLNSILVASPVFNWEGSQLAANLAQNTDMGGIRGNTFIAMYQGQDADDLNELAYASILNDAKILIPTAEEREFFIHSGIAKVFQAYVLVTMSDLFGDIPWTEALDPNNLNPNADTSREIYAAADALLLAAIVDLGKGGPIPTNDVFFAGDAASWISVAKSLRFRNNVNVAQADPGAVATLNALIADADLLDDNGMDFAFPHSTVAANPDSRSQYFIDNYVTGSSDYQANHMMWAMYVEKTNIDPRIRYYFYRQVLVPTEDVNELNCINAPRPAHYPANQPYCDLEDGYWGRDMHDINGIPPDNLLRTNFGVYPAGGRFDDESAAAVLPADGMAGAGIRPYLMSFNIAFLKAEAALTLGTTGDARVLFDAALQMSFDAVRAFAMGGAEAATITAYETAATVVYADDVASYKIEVLNRYDAAATDAAKLDIMQQEFQIATFGNGHEAYAAYRRTGLPGTSYMQNSLSPSPGGYMTSLLYPDNMASRNSSITQKSVTTVRPFWVTVDQSMFFQ